MAQMKIGYARVSTEEQNPELQIDALKAAGCERIFIDKVSGSKSDRPQLELAMQMLRKGDTLVVWRLDRLGRSLKNLLGWVNHFSEAGIHFESVQEKIDTSSPTGKLVFHMFASIAEFERDLIRERTKAGLDAARARGRKGGRKPKLDTKQKQALVELYKGKQYTIAELCDMFSISRRLLYHVVKQEPEAAK